MAVEEAPTGEQAELTFLADRSAVKLNNLGDELKTFVPSEDPVVDGDLGEASAVGDFLLAQGIFTFGIGDDDDVAISQLGSVRNQLKTGFFSEEAHDEGSRGRTHLAVVHVNNRSGRHVWQLRVCCMVPNVERNLVVANGFIFVQIVTVHDRIVNVAVAGIRKVTVTHQLVVNEGCQFIVAVLNRNTIDHDGKHTDHVGSVPCTVLSYVVLKDPVRGQVSVASVCDTG